MRLNVGVGMGLALAASLLASPGFADSRVEDRAGVLFETTETELEARLDAMAERTGVNVSVMVVDNLAGATAEEAARSSPPRDQPGQRLVLLVAMTERQVRIEADRELSARHSDAAWARLIETQMLGALRAGRQGTAIRQGLDAIEAELLGQDRASSGSQGGTLAALRDTIFVLVAGLLAVLSFNRVRRERVCRARG